ncbi:MAG: hypothetical protein K2X54_11440 [Methylobacterium organophilum]|nr:hypothetical protein [Methylobacterium organophilum]
MTEVEEFAHGYSPAYIGSLDEPYETFAESYRELMAAQAVEITRLIVSNPVAIAAIRAYRGPLPWKRLSIRAARRNRGRMRGAMRAETRRRA